MRNFLSLVINLSDAGVSSKNSGNRTLYTFCFDLWFFVGTDIVDGPGLCSLMDSWPNYQLTQVGPTQAHLTMGDFFFFLIKENLFQRQYSKSYFLKKKWIFKGEQIIFKCGSTTIFQIVNCLHNDTDFFVYCF